MAIRFAVTGLERSGTAWLASVLDCDPAVRVYHEPEPLKVADTQTLDLSHSGELDAQTYVKSRYAYWQRVAAPNGTDRAEVNAMIRHIAGAIQTVYQIPVAAIVRDGRYTVRSLVKRGAFVTDARTPVPAPRSLCDDPFAACCWYWADAYERIDGDHLPIWRLEDLNQDWPAFRGLCTYLGVEVSEADWARFAGKRQNESILVPELGWTAHQAQLFNALAGWMQDRFRYPRAEGMA